MPGYEWALQTKGVQGRAEQKGGKGGRSKLPDPYANVIGMVGIPFSGGNAENVKHHRVPLALFLR
jgi:hypothetical protein